MSFRSLGNRGACSTQFISTHGRGPFSSRPSAQRIQRKRRPLLAGNDPDGRALEAEPDDNGLEVEELR